MIKRMASKLHIGHHRVVDSSDSSSAASSSYTSAPSLSTLSLSLEHRASISTERTSLHEWVKTQNEVLQQAQRPIQTEEAALQVRRTKGSYRLTDFIIQRTLGTGSFGRVHLGEFSPFVSAFPLGCPFFILPSCPSPLIRVGVLFAMLGSWTCSMCLRALHAFAL